MQFILINNGTKHLEQLLHWLAGNEIEIKNPGQDLENINAQLVVLSGSSSGPLIGNENKYSAEIALVQSGTIPIIGICFGYEIIARAFGSTLKMLQRKEQGMVQIDYIGAPLFNTQNKYEYEGHRWVVEQLGPDLVAVAQSVDGIEIIKHKTLPIYGFQFHPEVTGEPTVSEILKKIKLTV